MIQQSINKEGFKYCLTALFVITGCIPTLFKRQAKMKMNLQKYKTPQSKHAMRGLNLPKT
ncbi:hypothetical protein C7N43_37700 [Sphingobacteriales bacterium UPWRP_1]|nr:hypothetical protein BVG80_07705 [Sphingobacteriales bacterium TSM_CSM]PSJ71753.1 hypothetical protein C7N43_37700 [Sphingobacteriales bacterium UPWRP_1]